ncbi:MAG: threonine/serine dehydratase [Candidatus Promineifilaceae bacterium]
MSTVPTLQDILKARKVIKQYLPKTPLHNYPALDQLVGAEVYVKHENYQPIGVFKARGGINLIFNLSSMERSKGVITASTGNHGQSVAYAARLFGVPASIVIPEDANPVKVEAMKSLGARIIIHGRDFDDARAHAKRVAEKEGSRFISSGNEPLLISGVGTYSLEIMEDLPEVEIIIVPVGAGSGASGACIVAKSINPNVEIIAVQAAAAPSAYLTWKNREPTEAQMETAAEGLATRAPFMIPQEILWQHLDDFVLVSDEEMRNAVRLYLEKAKTLAELAGAAPLAAALKLKERVKGKKIALVLSGGNISPEKLRNCLA